MMFTDTTFIGIDIQGNRKPLTYAALDGKLDLLALGQGPVDEVLAFVSGQERVLVAVNNPRKPNQGFMADEAFRDSLRPRPKPGRWDRWRVAEYQLRQHRIKVRRTPGDADHAPVWMRIGFALFSTLDDLGFQPCTSAFDPQSHAEREQLKVSIETYPHATFTALLERLPFPRGTLEGRIQRQLALFAHEVEVPDPMQIFEEITRFRLLKGELQLDKLLEATQLDALAAAYTARMVGAGEAVMLGHPEEGQIAVPVAQLLPRYS